MDAADPSRSVGRPVLAAHHPRRAKAFWLPISDARDHLLALDYQRDRPADRHPLTRHQMAWPEAGDLFLHTRSGAGTRSGILRFAASGQDDVLTLSAAAGASIAMFQVYRKEFVVHYVRL